VIVLILGTNGSGKSTLVRNVLDSCEYRTPLHREGRVRPFGYMVRRRRPDKPFFVLGHYEIANGGLDTMSTDEAFGLAERYARQTKILLEGNRAASVGRLSPLTRMFPGRLHVVRLTTPVEQCVQSVRDRGHDIAERVIVKTDAAITRCCATLESAAVCPVFRFDRTEALRKVRDLMELW
jgi:hypothetical protein